MRYGTEITKRICEELQKTPIVRHVCNKVEIDHSTFYRWLSKHYSFYQRVTAAIAMGRDRINDAAEGVVITGIQNNDQKAAAYWLSHNNPRYSSREQAQYLEDVNENYIELLSEPLPEGSSEATFEALFDSYHVMEEIFGVEAARKRMEPFVKLVCHGDSQLEEIFYTAYAEWKTDKDEYERKDKEVEPLEE